MFLVYSGFGLYRFLVYSGFGFYRFLVYTGFGFYRFLVYSGFGLYRFLVYSGFGFYRFLVYSGFGFYRYLVYSWFFFNIFLVYTGFGLDKFHCSIILVFLDNYLMTSPHAHMSTPKTICYFLSLMFFECFGIAVQIVWSRISSTRCYVFKSSADDVFLENPSSGTLSYSLH